MTTRSDFGKLEKVSPRNVIDLAASAADRRKSRIEDLASLLELDQSRHVKVVLQSPGDKVPAVLAAGTSVMLVEEGELQVWRLTSLLGYARMPFTWGELRGLLKYGGILVMQASKEKANSGYSYVSEAELRLRAESELMVAGDIEGLARSHLETGRTLERLSVEWEAGGDTPWGPDFLASMVTVGQKITASWELINRWYEDLKFFGNYSAPYVPGQHPLLTMPELAPLRALPISGGPGLKITLGEMVSGEPKWAEFRKVCGGGGLSKYGICIHSTDVLPYGQPEQPMPSRVGYLELELSNTENALAKVFKKLKVKPETWVASVAPFAHSIRLGSPPLKTFGGWSLVPTMLAFTVPLDSAGR